MGCPMCDTVARAMRRDHPLLIAGLRETIVILGENQGCPGWCVAMLKEHQEHMAAMSLERQARVFEDVARVAAAVRSVFGPLRINYECLGNQVAHVHWHIIPRHAEDPAPRQPVWGWTPEQLKGTLDERGRTELAARIRDALTAH